MDTWPTSADPADVSASLCRELKDPYVYMPKTKKTGAPKKLIRVGRAEGGGVVHHPDDALPGLVPRVLVRVPARRPVVLATVTVVLPEAVEPDRGDAA